MISFVKGHVTSEFKSQIPAWAGGPECVLLKHKAVQPPRQSLSPESFSVPQVQGTISRFLVLGLPTWNGSYLNSFKVPSKIPALNTSKDSRAIGSSPFTLLNTEL